MTKKFTPIFPTTGYLNELYFKNSFLFRFSDELFFNNLYAPLDVGFSSHDLSKIHPSITSFNASHMPKYVSLKLLLLLLL